MKAVHGSSATKFVYNFRHTNGATRQDYPVEETVEHKPEIFYGACTSTYHVLEKGRKARQLNRIEHI